MQRIALTASAIVALAAGTAVAQTAQKPAAPSDTTGQQQTMSQQQTSGQPQVAQKCLDELQQLGQRMRKDGYWLTGYRSPRGAWGYGYGAMGPGLAGPAAPGAVPPTGQAPAAGQQAAQDQPAAKPQTAAPAGPAQPWGEIGWAAPPGPQIHTLYAAASLLGQMGDEQTCEAVTAKLQQVYGHYVDQLRQAGVEPGEVSGWRGQQILAAKPVDQVGVVRVNDVVGTGVWNEHDKQLGTVDDVVLSPKSGKIDYAVVAFGGFLGIGDSYVPVPWQEFEATPGLSMMVLKVDQQTLENAPHATPAQLAQAGQDSSIHQKINSYWQEAKSGTSAKSAG